MRLPGSWWMSGSTASHFLANQVRKTESIVVMADGRCLPPARVHKQPPWGRNCEFDRSHHGHHSVLIANQPRQGVHSMNRRSSLRTHYILSPFVLALFSLT